MGEKTQEALKLQLLCCVGRVYARSDEAGKTPSSINMECTELDRHCAFMGGEL